MSEQLPKPLIDSDSKPFWEGLKRHELLIQHCDECEQPIFYPRVLCPHCFSDKISWRQASGHGSIYSYTVVHRAFGPFSDQAPYIVAIVELDEGVRMMTRIIGDQENVKIGVPVEVVYEKVDEEMVLPYFKVV